MEGHAFSTAHLTVPSVENTMPSLHKNGALSMLTHIRVHLESKYSDAASMVLLRNNIMEFSWSNRTRCSEGMVM